MPCSALSRNALFQEVQPQRERWSIPHEFINCADHSTCQLSTFGRGLWLSTCVLRFALFPHGAAEV
eukprot:5767835-Amphidinium_carterae.1